MTARKNAALKIAESLQGNAGSTGIVVGGAVIGITAHKVDGGGQFAITARLNFHAGNLAASEQAKHRAILCLHGKAGSHLASAVSAHLMARLALPEPITMLASMPTYPDSAIRWALVPHPTFACLPCAYPTCIDNIQPVQCTGCAHATGCGPVPCLLPTPSWT